MLLTSTCRSVNTSATDCAKASPKAKFRVLVCKALNSNPFGKSISIDTPKHGTLDVTVRDQHDLERKLRNCGSPGGALIKSGKMVDRFDELEHGAGYTLTPPPETSSGPSVENITITSPEKPGEYESETLLYRSFTPASLLAFLTDSIARGLVPYGQPSSAVLREITHLKDGQHYALVPYP